MYEHCSCFIFITCYILDYELKTYAPTRTMQPNYVICRLEERPNKNSNTPDHEKGGLINDTASDIPVAHVVDAQVRTKTPIL